MPKLIYAEPDDEITNLVDRLRSEKEEQDLVFVLPAASRVLQSGLNARLLMQYSNSLGKTTAIVSPDQRTQAMGIETGFRVFGSLAAYETGAPLTAAAAGPAGVNGTPVLAPVTPRATPAPPRRPPPAVPRPAPARPAPRATPAAAAGDPPDRIRIYVVGGLAAMLLLCVAALAFLPTATVEIIVDARPVQTTATVAGSTAGPGPSDQLAVQTTLVTAQEQNQQQVTSTGTKVIPATPSTGTVIFTNNGGICGPYVDPPVDFQKGIDVYTDSGIHFTTQADSGVIPAGKPSGPIPVTASSAGASTNVAAGAIDHVSGGGCPSNYSVTNPQATSGGADQQQKTVISQQDLDNVKSSLGNPLQDKVKQDLQQKFGGQKPLTETQVIDVAATYDHKLGDETPNFNATVVVKGRVTTVDDAKVKHVLRVALEHTVPAGYALTDNALKLDYSVASHDDNGGVIFDGNVSGYIAASVDIPKLQQQVAGKSPAQARSLIETTVDAPNPVIRQNPPFLPWLPWIPSHIQIKRLVQNIQAG
ncbi:MAG TPA: baseplate J/gp47 family protein [Candidatus Dormibacteraeota bacterium]|jgi:hypothetical protein|nr:baseplate J/gp47 family protein [Candidatus Dormibacteraeota bacterium]